MWVFCKNNNVKSFSLMFYTWKRQGNVAQSITEMSYPKDKFI